MSLIRNMGWKPINPDYEVSNRGLVRRQTDTRPYAAGFLIKPHIRSGSVKNYYYLYLDGSRKSITVFKLMEQYWPNVTFSFRHWVSLVLCINDYNKKFKNKPRQKPDKARLFGPNVRQCPGVPWLGIKCGRKITNMRCARCWQAIRGDGIDKHSEFTDFSGECIR